MLYRLLTDVAIIVHFSFLTFVVAGGVLARRRRWIVPLHLLAVAWGVYVEATPGIICPLTAVENYLAVRAGGAGYGGGFIEHYLIPVIYPDGLGPQEQWALAALVALINVVVYAWPRRRLTSEGTQLGTSPAPAAERRVAAAEAARPPSSGHVHLGPPRS